MSLETTYNDARDIRFINKPILRAIGLENEIREMIDLKVSKTSDIERLRDNLVSIQGGLDDALVKSFGTVYDQKT